MFGLNLTQGLVLLSVLLLVAVLIHGRFGTGRAFALLAAGYYFSGLVDTSTVLGSVVDPVLVALVLLVLVSRVLEKSVLIDQLAERLLAGSYRFALARLVGATAGLSAFLNNTAVVALFMGAVSRQQRHAPSRLLMPLSFAAVLGGTITLVGTSTNLIVAGLASRAGVTPPGMFDFAWVGLPAALAGAVVMLLSASRLLPRHPAETEVDSSYFLEASLAADSPLVGRTVEAAGLRNLDGLFLVELVRRGQLLSPVAPDAVLLGDDILVFTGAIEKVQLLDRFEGLKLFEQPLSIVNRNLVEVVVMPGSTLVGQTIREAGFRALFNAAVVGVRRGEERLSGQLGRIRMHAGDALLLATGSDFLKRRNLERNFYLLKGGRSRRNLGVWPSLIGLGGFGLVILGNALAWFSLVKGLAALLLLMLVAGWTTTADLRRRFPFDLVLIVASALVTSHVLIQSGVAGWLAGGLQSVASAQAGWLALALVFLCTLALTELMSNAAAAAIVFPVAVALAQGMGFQATPFVMAVAFGASASFMTPMGYQTHLMVLTPGRYRFGDFLRFGLPVSLAYGLTVVALLPWFYPLHGG